MPSISVDTIAGPAIDLDIPEPGYRESCFFVGVHKGGSTLLANVAKLIASHGKLSFYSLPIDLWRKGIRFDNLTPSIDKIFMRDGYCYGGFKGLVDPIRLPAHASGRTILLVRDPRDMVTSQYFSVAISHPPPGASLSTDRLRAFEARRARVREMTIDDYVVKASSVVAKAYETTLSKLNDIDHKFYRYEDVVFDKITWIGDMAAYLNIEFSSEIIADIARRVDVVPQQENAGRHIRKVSPGDHKDKLQSRTIEILNDKFARVMNKLHYQ